MKTKLLLASVLLALSPAAHAGAFSDTLSVCLVKSTTDKEKTLLVRWIFAAVSRNPDVKDLVHVPKDEEEKLNREVAQLFMTLMTERCASETTDAVKYEGDAAISAGFQALGQVAGQGLMNDPEVSAFASGLAAYLDKDQLEKLGRQVSPQDAPAPADKKK